LSQNGTVDVIDVNWGVNMVLGSQPCTANINGAGVCTVVTVQRVVNAALGQACVTDSISHTVFLSWVASTTANVTYNVFRGTTSGGPYTKLTATPIAATSYTDNSVPGGQTFFYVARSVNGNGESSNSNQAVAVVPSP
jgi:hypothetical protein